MIDNSARGIWALTKSNLSINQIDPERLLELSENSTNKQNQKRKKKMTTKG